MPQFRFRLATLLRLRESARDEKRAHLAEAQRAALVLEDRLMEVRQEMSATRQAAHDAALPGGVDVDRLLQTHRYELLLSAQVRLIEQQQQQIAAEMERRRLALVEADRQVRVLEKLREKQSQTFHQEEAARDVKLMDELAQRTPARLGELQP